MLHSLLKCVGVVASSAAMLRTHQTSNSDTSHSIALAMSSKDRCTLQWAELQIKAGGTTPTDVQQTVMQRVAEGGGRVDYVVVVDAENLQPLQQFLPAGGVLVALAAFFGTVRLIDNVVATCKA